MDDKTHIKLETECTDGSGKHKFNLQYYIYKDEDVYIAYCPSLDITTSGVNFNDAVTQFYENFQLYVEFCLDEGTLIDDLIAHGWKMEGTSLIQPSFESLLSKKEFRYLMESDKEYDRLNARVELQPIPA